MAEITTTNGTTVLIDDVDLEQAVQYVWRVDNGGYVYNLQPRGIRPRHLHLHRLITNAPANMVVDHINHDPLDNRQHNLRVCTIAQNAQNQVIRQGGTSQFKGVYWNKNHRRWYAIIRCDGKPFFLGSFTDETSAAFAYDAAATRLHKEFANLNFPERQAGV